MSAAESRSFGRCVRRGLWLPLALAVITAGFKAVSLARRPPSYTSLAKFAVNGPGANEEDKGQNLYRTTIETLDGGEMRRHALERIRVLNRGAKEADVGVLANQNEGSAIINVVAIGSDKEFTKTFLDALLDEYEAMRERNRLEQRNKASQVLADEAAKSGKAVKAVADKLATLNKAGAIDVLKALHEEQPKALEALMMEKRTLLAAAAGANVSVAERNAEQQRLPILEREIAAVKQEIADTSGKLAEYERLEKDLAAAQKGNQDSLDSLNKFSASEDAREDDVSITERASTAVEDAHPWLLSFILALAGGLASGLALLLAGATLWVFAAPRQALPQPAEEEGSQPL